MELVTTGKAAEISLGRSNRRKGFRASKADNQTATLVLGGQEHGLSVRFIDGPYGESLYISTTSAVWVLESATPWANPLDRAYVEVMEDGPILIARLQEPKATGGIFEYTPIGTTSLVGIEPDQLVTIKSRRD